MEKIATYFLVVLDTAQFTALPLARDLGCWPELVSSTSGWPLDLGIPDALAELDLQGARTAAYLVAISVYLILFCFNMASRGVIMPRWLRKVISTTSVLLYSVFVMFAYHVLLKVVEFHTNKNCSIIN